MRCCKVPTKPRVEGQIGSEKSCPSFDLSQTPDLDSMRSYLECGRDSIDLGVSFDSTPYTQSAKI